MTAGEPIDEFHVCGLLPTGVTVLEASAGTGKTFAIAALATRYVADGLPLDHLLLVTFTRYATSELRERVRERMVSAEQGLAGALRGVEPRPDDPVLGLLAAGPPELVRTRRQRLATALSNFDSATIATTHGFCQHVLNGLGVTGDVEGDVTFVEDPGHLVDQVVTDLYVRKFGSGVQVPFSLAQAVALAQAAVANPDAVLMPSDARRDSGPDLRWRLALRARQEVDHRRRHAAVLTYDDLLTRLRDTLAHPHRGEAACRRLQERYRVVLIDEFQDTDPVQWQILRLAFGRPGSGSTLVLIGDAKQAIYAFRGADVYSYLHAASIAGTRATLGVNHRSRQRLLDAYDVLFDGARLGHEGIVYRPVRASTESGPCDRAMGDRAMGDRAADPGLRVRVLHRRDKLAELTPKGYLSVNGARDAIARDLAADIARAVSAGSIRPDEKVAVLVRRHADASLIRQHLGAAGVPAVVNGASSVMTTPAAQEWLCLLRALEQPSSTYAARAVALTPFLGWSAAQVAQASETELEWLHTRLHRWSAVLRGQGVAAMYEVICRTGRLAARTLEGHDGERRLTDLGHVSELLHLAAKADQLGVTALAGWLRERIDEGKDKRSGDREGRSRRLESDDAEAVQILTIYRSKGQEFDVVYCPFLWDSQWIPENDPPTYHDADNSNRRTLYVGGRNGQSWKAAQQALVESRGEELRLIYVALTRAKRQATIWWAGCWGRRDNSGDSGLARLLFRRDEEGNVKATGKGVPDDDAVVARLSEMADRSGGAVAVERVGQPMVDDIGRSASPPTHPSAPTLSVRSCDRTIDLAWRRTSYSAITAGVHEARVASEPDQVRETDEPVDVSDPDTVPVGSGPSAALPLGAVPLGAMPLGAGPLGAGPLGAVPLGAVPLGSVPLGSVASGAGPLISGLPGAGPLNSGLPGAGPLNSGRPGAGPIDAGASSVGGLSPGGSADSVSVNRTETPAGEDLGGGDGREEALLGVACPLGTMPAGAAVGTFVHGVLEATDFAAADLAAELSAAMARMASRDPVQVGPAELLVAGLAAAIDTPLGPLVDDLALRRFGRTDRVDEMSFELPLVGGDRPTGQLAVAQIGQLLTDHLPSTDPMAGYGPRLGDPSLESALAGYLSGSIDSVLRTPDGRYLVVDYKTNRLGAPGQPLTAWHYRPAALAEAMSGAHYPLQAALYTVALHRYLRGRLRAYDPRRHLGGVLYLFVRGMIGPATPRVEGQPCGVFAWAPPAALVEALSDLLDRGTVEP
ncbi:MAG: UvrD-helicase domain-containing protein [Acidimicrobiales bacterium]